MALVDDTHSPVTTGSNVSTTTNIVTDGANELITVRSSGDFGSTGGSLSISAAGNLSTAVWTPIIPSTQDGNASPLGDFRVFRAWYTYANTTITSANVTITPSSGGGGGTIQEITVRAYKGANAIVNTGQTAIGTSGSPSLTVTVIGANSRVEALGGGADNPAFNAVADATSTLDNSDLYAVGPSWGWSQRSTNLVSANFTIGVTNTSTAWGIGGYEIREYLGPTITAQPTSTVVSPGSTATFQVTASGLTPTYQWQRDKNDGNGFANVSGATSSSYTTPNTTIGVDNLNIYRVVVSDSGGNTTSSSATLYTVVPLKVGIS